MLFSSPSSCTPIEGKVSKLLTEIDELGSLTARVCKVPPVNNDNMGELPTSNPCNEKTASKRGFLRLWTNSLPLIVCIWVLMLGSAKSKITRMTMYWNQNYSKIEISQ